MTWLAFKRAHQAMRIHRTDAIQDHAIQTRGYARILVVRQIAAGNQQCLST